MTPARRSVPRRDRFDLAVPRDLTDLPFAGALRRYTGEPNAAGDYDRQHFDGERIIDAAVQPSTFAECAFTGVTIDGGRYRKCRFHDVWFRDVRLLSTDLAETEWLGTWLVNCAVAGTQVFGSSMRRVVLRGGKLDSVNFRAATLTDVTFEDCLLRDADFSNATLVRVRFPGSRLVGADFSNATLDRVDLRHAELGITGGYTSLRGAVIDSTQLIALAPLLAHQMGIEVRES